MERSTKESWLAADAGDLEEQTLEDCPVPGQSIKIRALSATSANAANSRAITTYEEAGKPRYKVDSVELDCLRFQEGVIEPKFTTEECRIISGKFGPAFNRVITAIVKLSGLDAETATETDARFQGSGSGQNGTDAGEPAGGGSGSAVPARTGARTRNDGD